MKYGGMLLTLLLWAQIGWAGPIELEQFLEFKWRGLTVATMNFAVSIPSIDEPSVLADEGDKSFEPRVLIELVGQTKGPLRWLEDYQATVQYIQMDARGLENAFTLTGTDNGDPERRHIVFDANRLPEVRLFDDSTASQALVPQSDWRGNTINPLGVFKKMLLAAARQESCEDDVWGYDGKRRYRLTLRDIALPKEVSPSDGATAMQPEVTDYVYTCELTMYAEGRHSASGQSAKLPLLARRFAALWPFGIGDRRIIFVIKAVPSMQDNTVPSLVLADIRILTPIGTIVASHSF